mmetsp:Transcript_14356/g.22644  ORF Transcript_14356/g.22644 Transcript_14356/m.22644 type:complete len:431 (-) Transcript_14356:72-1364(-)
MGTWLSVDALLSIALLCPSIVIFFVYVKNEDIVREILASMVFGVLGYFSTSMLIPYFKGFVNKRNLTGRDLCKKGTEAGEKDIPEAMGIVPCLVFLVCMTTCQLFYASSREQLVDYNSALLSICFMMFLGFLDDVLDLPWRIKMFLPSFASLPLLVTYDGSTWVTVPNMLRGVLCNDGGGLTQLGALINTVFTVDATRGAIINLGFAYMVYMGMLAVFCTNAINIYAGINGLEAGQSYVIGCALLLFNMIEIALGHEGTNNERIFAVMLLFPFVAVTLGLLKHNWYPSQVFVGDTFCYFAGMTFAVTGIHGHFSKTLLLMFIPQVLNFLLSVPQLFKLVPCPRHRLPKFDPRTGLLGPSGFPCRPGEHRLLKVRPEDEFCPNLTLVCAALRAMGPTHERALTRRLLGLQVLCCGLGFAVRYYVAGLVFAP